MRTRRLGRLRLAFYRERGQSVIEYALILVLIAAILTTVMITLGNQVRDVFCNLTGVLA